MSAKAIVTSFSVEGAALYGRRCVASWSHWPASVDRIAYVDAPMDLDVETRLTGDISGLAATVRALPHTNPSAEKPTNYIWNARRFAIKPYVWRDAATRLGEGILVWLDGDTITTAGVPETCADDWLGAAHLVYLGRGAMHPETGCVLFRLPQALPAIEACVRLYETGAYRAIDSGWTDCHVLRQALRTTPIWARDLTSHRHLGNWTSRVDAFALSPLGPYVTHLKGTQRKREAMSA